MHVLSRWLFNLLTNISPWLAISLNELSPRVPLFDLLLLCDSCSWCLNHRATWDWSMVLFQILILREISTYSLSIWIVVKGLWNNLVMKNLVWSKFWRGYFFLARKLATCTDVLFKAMLNIYITWSSSTGGRLLITYGFVHLAHIMSWHFLEIATRSVKFLCCSYVSADLFFLFTGRLSIIALRTVFTA